MLTKNEQRVLYGLIRYPGYIDRDLADVLELKESTLTSIKKRLESQGYYKSVFLPRINRLGCELLGVIFTNFNPVRSLEDRIRLTKEKIEISEEIFLSAGILEQGFSFSFVKNYTDFARINEIRTDTFGRESLLEKELPHEILFPFAMTTIRHFFDYSRLLANLFNNQHGLTDIRDHSDWFRETDFVELSPKERNVFAALIRYPDYTNEEIGNLPHIQLSRHTIARMKHKFMDQELLIEKLNIPNLIILNLNLVVLYDFQFNPSNPISESIIDQLDSPSTIFLAFMKFKAVFISAYKDYNDYKEDKERKFAILKQANHLNYTPDPRKFVVDRMKIIKNFEFAQIVEKVLSIPPRVASSIPPTPTMAPVTDPEGESER